MKKKQVVRLYNFPDAELVTIANDKLAFLTRDAAQFADFGITTAMVNTLKTKVTLFSNFTTDVESLSDQTAATALKDAKAEEIRTAIRAVMARAENKFGVKSPKYRKFGASDTARQTDSNLFITAKRVVRVGTTFLPDLAANGLTAAMLANITTLCNSFEALLVDMGIKIGDRDIQQEDRVEAGNAIYSELIKYTNTGQSIWSATDVAKYNDYVVYNTPTGTAPVVVPPTT